ncbi:4Fe-4S dicluster domain-containing protein [Candidatus Margulisiibacteriota bacterium]
MKLPKIREVIEAVKSLVLGPYTSKFPKVPHEPAEGFRGKALFYEEDCVGCGACAEVCPARAIAVEEELQDGNKGIRRLTLRHTKCIFCGQCERNCITKKGVKLTTEYELSTFKKEEVSSTVEKALVFCESCSMPITAYDHIKWMADRVGTLTFTNPTLYLTAMKDLDLIDKGSEPIPNRPHKRSDQIKILCPHCRRETTLSEAWG